MIFSNQIRAGNDINHNSIKQHYPSWTLIQLNSTLPHLIVTQPCTKLHNITHLNQVNPTRSFEHDHTLHLAPLNPSRPLLTTFDPVLQTNGLTSWAKQQRHLKPCMKAELTKFQQQQKQLNNLLNPVSTQNYKIITVILKSCQNPPHLKAY